MSSVDAYASLEQTGRDLQSGALTSEALVRLRLDRIQRHDPALNAYMDVYADSALAAAKAADALRAAGVVLGPLHGITVAIKDLFDIAGRPVTCGSKSMPPRIPDRTATVVRKLQAAGAIVLGKTQTVEFAFGGWGTNASFGTPRNPWDMQVHRVPGGSSSGSGVAVAAGLACAAIGTDTGGSVRIPASMCGLVGLKTTVGLVSRDGLMPLSATLDTVGPMTHTVTDAALMLDAIAGPDPLDASTRHAPARSVLPGLRDGVDGMRVWAMPDEERAGIDDAVLAAYEQALETLRTLGARVVRRPLPRGSTDAMTMAGGIMAAEGYAALRAIGERDDLQVDPYVRRRILAGRGIGAAEYIDLLRARERAKAEMMAAMVGTDFLLLPTTPLPAIPVQEADQATSTLARLNRMANLLDMCSVAVPSGFTETGLPLSVQFAGRGMDEPVILRAAYAYEQATPWRARRPVGLD
ncbi:amidase [Bordetella bronchialis]|uniref:Glutamyl-tRNA amidotransferase n=1 Tax=Bordetella bronchialis TaxID=463025 RepID=A0A193FFG7_9BORD|nr:amidase [Bordetella bronchialis]ANN65849.1 glutamyl-tRNA amidotransferase [Bordetella bronchialis]ANN70934.1 glutamyl-tRNA amidotransferase [Bordetella bronchialis]